MLGSSGKQNKSALRKSVYQDLDEKDFQRILEEKDTLIQSLEIKIERMQKLSKDMGGSRKNDNDTAQDFFKLKLQQTIQMAQTALHSFLDINDHLKKLVISLKAIVEEKDESIGEVKDLIEMINSVSGQSSYSSYQAQTQLSLQFFLKIEKQSEGLMEQLSMSCDNLNKNYTKTRKDYIWLENKHKQYIKQTVDEISGLKTEISESLLLRDQIKGLLMLNQKQKKEIMNKIQSIMDQATKKQLEKMDREKMIDFIKKLLYKMNQTEKNKQVAIKQNKKLKSEDLKKYQKMLLEVKQAKQISKLGNSKIGKSVGY